MMNEVVGDRNNFEKKEGIKSHMWVFSKKWLWGFIGFVILEVIYGKTGCSIWVKSYEYENGKVKDKNPKIDWWENIFTKNECTSISF